MPFREGRTIVGWGVVRRDPWEFDAVYQTREEAKAEAAKLGPEFQVSWGEHQEGTDNFILLEPSDDGRRRITEDGSSRVTEDGDSRVTENDPYVDRDYVATEDGDYLVTEEGDHIVTEDGDRIRLEGDMADAHVESQPEQAKSDEELQSIDEMGGPFDPDADSDTPSGDGIAASSWTGRLSNEEQITIVKRVGPVASACVRDLIDAIEAKRLNDPEVQDTLEQLRDLHQALGELIKLAEAGKPLTQIMEVIEARKEKIADSIKGGAQVMLVAPAVAYGTSFVLSLLTGFPMSDNMVTGLCAAVMGKDALIALAKR